MDYIKKFLASLFKSLLLLLFGLQIAQACPICASEIGQAVRYGIIHQHFLLFISSIILSFSIFCSAVFIISKYIAFTNKKSSRTFCQQLVAAMLLGGGLAAFLDGIVFHQVLQTHNMVSNFLPILTLVNLEINMFWDGIFQLFALLMVIAGVILLWLASKDSVITLSNKSFMGWNLLGFGLFNFIEGLINHQLIQLHHVIQRTSENWQIYSDILFLLAALISISIGMILIRNR